MRYALLPILLVGAACHGGVVSSPLPKDSIIRDSAGVDIGRVTLREVREHVQVDIRVAGLQPGLHGVHLHAAASCEAPGFQSAGAHFNPTEMKHGRLNPAGPHAGDLGNLNVENDGRGVASVALVGALERTSGLKGLLGTAGLSLIVHAAKDDELTDPSGNSGARIACAVINP